MNHLKEVGIGYFSHMIRAVLFSSEIMLVAIILLIHAVAPFIFCDTASKRIADINQRIKSLNKTEE